MIVQLQNQYSNKWHQSLKIFTPFHHQCDLKMTRTGNDPGKEQFKKFSHIKHSTYKKNA